ncbi:sugar phosphate isomerase/epimerase family protein [Allorhodopirellula heiligendammensis]|uniref:Inosose isomerase n=1 Tax=Allorhodopirellula heiligendammensis TaxID=2714739 RepID=A0A5C6BUG9_9BACT|nr:sugar phosphate isomerase/epimerase family protein [Allorhodopirellula heiligendammensis]TWU15913.1 Inosose isomerase [Allorhodopirellula heiligendammensis]
MSAIPRRHFLSAAAGAGVLSATVRSSSAIDQAGNPVEKLEKQHPQTPPLSLNTSTIRGHKLSLPEQIRVTSAAGYDAIEPWIGDIRSYVDGGGTLGELRRQLDDAGLELAGAIGFAKWIANDDSERAAGLDEARRDMEMVRSLGGVRMAAPPIGAHTAQALAASGPIELQVVGERYRALLEVGDELGVTPLLELWGFSPTLSRLEELAYVATATAHRRAAVLPDFYHIYKGGSDMASLGMIEASRMPLFHINDYPSDPPRATISDKDRVFPGDGVCPLVPTIAMLLTNGFTGTFSLELFNPGYWKRPAEQVAKEGYEKSRAVIHEALQVVSNA